MGLVPDEFQLLNKDKKDFTGAAHSLPCLRIVSQEPGDGDGASSVDTPSVEAACPSRSCVLRMEMLEVLKEKRYALQARREKVQSKLASRGTVPGAL